MTLLQDVAEGDRKEGQQARRELKGRRGAFSQGKKYEQKVYVKSTGYTRSRQTISSASISRRLLLPGSEVVKQQR